MFIEYSQIQWHKIFKKNNKRRNFNVKKLISFLLSFALTVSCCKKVAFADVDVNQLNETQKSLWSNLSADDRHLLNQIHKEVSDPYNLINKQENFAKDLYDYACVLYRNKRSLFIFYIMGVMPVLDTNNKRLNGFYVNIANMANFIGTRKVIVEKKIRKFTIDFRPPERMFELFSVLINHYGSISSTSVPPPLNSLQRLRNWNFCRTDTFTCSENNNAISYLESIK